MQMILQYLSPSDLVRFFRTSKQALSFANLFCRSSPLHFYRCSADAASTPSEHKRILMIGLSEWARFSELDMRWQIVNNVAQLAKLQTIEVCSIQVQGKHYVCGVGFDTGRSKAFLGHKTEDLHTFNIADTTTETIRLAVDALGIRSIKYGDSPWFFGGPGSLFCWEGLSIRQGNRKIRIIRDALKFRHLKWHREAPHIFEETVLMRNQHPFPSSTRGCIAEEYYVRQHPEEERA
ncbi:hypothetical protein AJ79_04836 [Helicocarpus griseus UAMH5409]|uniref:Uncharacterized protein n=1 Tax=Helicocarpus griseus UAMH5409 TaxID=1447875 RepID=A0A2B7XRS2_9EURO|nr:hypothetical protein AJ79_04836 [Helicocarpus griseus UAMH5409]